MVLQGRTIRKKLLYENIREHIKIKRSPREKGERGLLMENNHVKEEIGETIFSEQWIRGN